MPPKIWLPCSRLSGGRWRAQRPPLLRPGAAVRLGRHHAAGGPGRIAAGSAEGKGGAAEPEPGVLGADCQTMLE